MKSIIGISSSILALFAPVHSLICCALLFICINFLTGVIASYKRATRQGKPWAFESPKAWRTLYKLIFIAGGIVMLWLIDTSILSFANLHLANLFTGFACGVELWSYLENAAEISEHAVFRSLKRFMKQRVDRELNA